MPPLYVVQQNAKLRIRNGKLRVEVDKDEDGEIDLLVDVPLIHVSEVILFGNVGLTTPAVDALLSREIPVVFLTRDGVYRGQLTGCLTPHVKLRQTQYQRIGEPAFVLEMSRCIVAAKLRHQKVLLQRRSREQPNRVVDAAVQRIETAQAAVRQKTTCASLRGLEGTATRAYFRGFRSLFASEWRFDRRLRRPPPDPVNVLLSFGYTLLAQLASGAVQAVGLDPYAGFLHEYVYNRQALALDLMEEFRPVVDGIVLWCCRSGVLTPGDFAPGPAERPVVLSEAGKKRFLQAFEQRMEAAYTHPVRGLKLPLRQCMIEQARQITRCVQSGQPEYRGMGFR